MNLEAYFQRIEYAGPRTTSMATLRELHAHHVYAIAFENLDALAGRPVQLDLPSLERKLVQEGRGGYCFEQNLLLKAALEELGFAVTGLAARVLWNAPSDNTPVPMSHMLLRVDLDDASYLVDAGFGGQTPTSPLLLEPEIEQSTPHEPYRLLEEEAEDEFKLQSIVAGEWKSLYRFSLRESFLADYEVANWYVSTHPTSHFRHRLMVSRPGPGLRRALLNRQLTIRRTDGTSERHELSSVDEMRAVLRDQFNIRLPDAPDLNAVLSRALAA